MTPLPLTDDTHLLVLTGAGVSAESGVPTFRGMGGHWRNYAVERVASQEGFFEDPGLVWQFYSERRAAAKTVQPNAGHLALAALEARLGDRLLLATQNVDGLHQRAGSQRVVEMHGSLWKTRCSKCDRAPFHDEASYDAHTLPGCNECHARGEFALLRPHIVWFGERLDPSTFETIEAFIDRAEGHHLIFMAVGTSGSVFPAAQLVDQARARGADTWLINAEHAANESAFHHVVLGQSGEVLPALFQLGAT
jgi:NAD-dependent deacetylase